MRRVVAAGCYTGNQARPKNISTLAQIRCSQYPREYMWLLLYTLFSLNPTSRYMYKKEPIDCCESNDAAAALLLLLLQASIEIYRLLLLIN